MTTRDYRSSDRRLGAVWLAAGVLLLGGPGLAHAVEVQADFNGDGFADLAIGVPGEAIGSVTRAGAVNVIYGKHADGLSALNNQLWHQDVPGILSFAQANDAFGAELAAGDFNGDAFADLAIGVAGEGIGSAIGAGAVQVLYGSGSGLSAAGSQFLRQDANLGGEAIEDAPESGDGFGGALAAGDFNGDGFVDLAIGVPEEDIGSVADTGAVNVIHGTPAGLAAADDQIWHQDIAGIEDTAEPFQRFGTALAAGDFDGDGRDDLAVGVPFEGVGSSFAGAVNVIYGSNQRLQAANNQLWHQDIAGIEDTAEPNDAFGLPLAAGDFNGDGRDDLAVGVHLEGVGKLSKLSSAGAVNVIYGSNDRLQATNDQLWHQNVTGIEDPAEPFDFFGGALAAGDFNADGRDDLAVGVSNEAIGSVRFTGAVNVIYGTTDRLQAANDQLWHQDSVQVLPFPLEPLAIEDAAEEDDRFGDALAATTSGGSFAAFVAGLSGEWQAIAQRCKAPGRCRIQGRIRVFNPGTATAARSVLRFFLSADETLDESDTLLRERTVKPLAPQESVRLKLQVRLAPGQDASGDVVIAVLDATDRVPEQNEDNNEVVSPTIP